MCVAQNARALSSTHASHANHIRLANIYSELRAAVHSILPSSSLSSLSASQALRAAYVIMKVNHPREPPPCVVDSIGITPWYNNANSRRLISPVSHGNAITVRPREFSALHMGRTRMMHLCRMNWNGTSVGRLSDADRETDIH